MKTILLFENDPDIGSLVMVILKDSYSVKLQVPVQNGLDSLPDFVPDLIIVDNYCGRISADNIVSVIKRQERLKKVPFILFTADNNIDRLAEEIGADAYLAKPFDIGELEKIVNSVIEDPNDSRRTLGRVASNHAMGRSNNFNYMQAV